MKADRATLLRLRRLERLRDGERMSAARDTAVCETALVRVELLARRTADLMRGQSGAQLPQSGADLQSRSAFIQEISALARRAAEEVAGAETGAQASRIRLAAASHRRDGVTLRADSLARKVNIERFAAENPVLARKLKGSFRPSE